MNAVRGKRRSRPSLAARVRTFWLAGVVAAGLAAWGGWTLATLPAFRLQSLATTGLVRVSRADVAARAAIDPQGNVWLLNRRGVERRIEAIPYVATARVHVRPVANVWIEVVERTADGCVRDRAGRTLTIDRERRILQAGCDPEASLAYDLRGRAAGAPGSYLGGAEIARLQDDAHALASRGDRFRAVGLDAFGQLEATLQDGIRVRFGDDGDLDRKQRLIAPILAELGPRVASVKTVDLRSPVTPVVEYRR